MSWGFDSWKAKQTATLVSRYVRITVVARSVIGWGKRVGGRDSKQCPRRWARAALWSGTCFYFFKDNSDNKWEIGVRRFGSIQCVLYTEYDDIVCPHLWTMGKNEDCQTSLMAGRLLNRIDELLVQCWIRVNCSLKVPDFNFVEHHRRLWPPSSFFSLWEMFNFPLSSSHSLLLMSIIVL